jgi:EAL domain-containing protein (putative c-di-GMP-specific phosphodiesterase class I)
VNPEAKDDARAHSSVLILDDEPLVAEALAAMLESEGRTVVVCHDTASAELALREFPFTHVISDLQLSNDVPFEGVRFVDTVRRAQPDSRIVVVSGFASYIVKSAALANGADAFLAKPFELEDIETALASGSDHRLDAAANGGRVVRVAGLDALLSPTSLTAHFQPIVNLQKSGWPVEGFKALARVAEGWPFSDMKTLFDYAARKHRLVELNTACLTRALRESSCLTPSALLFVIFDPAVISSGGVKNAVRRAASASNISPDRIVIELTENVINYDDASAFASVDELRSDGFKFAIGQAESALADTNFFDRVRPEFLKISHHAGASFQTDAGRTEIIRNMVDLGRERGITIVLDGIDSRETAEAARDCGVELAQGFWIGAPMQAAAAATFATPGEASKL